MKPHHVLVLVMGISFGIYFLMRPNPASTSTQTPSVSDTDDAAPPLPPTPPQPPPQMSEPTGPIVREREQPANATAMKVNWKLKLPNPLSMTALQKPGCYVFKDEKSFAAFFGAEHQRYIRWNDVNFSKQMAIVYVAKHADAAGIDALVRTPAEVVVFIKHLVHQRPQTPPAAMDVAVSGVVVNRSNLPVHTSDFDVVEP